MFLNNLPLALLIFLTCLGPICITGVSEKLILILVDGFSWYYLTPPLLNELNGLRQIVNEGIHVKKLRPVFPTLSRPNHWSLATGNYPESHGLLGNVFWDDSLKELYDSANPTSIEKTHWYNVQPIWADATESGKNTRVYFYQWCQVPYKAVKPVNVSEKAPKTYYCLPYPRMDNDNSKFRLFSDEEFGNAIQNAISNLANQTDFAVLYYVMVDHKAHLTGPRSLGATNAVKLFDEKIVKLINGLKNNSLETMTNIIIASDHGQTESYRNQTIELSDYISKALLERVVDRGPWCMIWPKKSEANKVYEKLMDMVNNTRAVTLYNGTDMPEALRFKFMNRTPPILAIANPHWFISTKQLIGKGGFDASGDVKGEHGYMHSLDDMQGIFVASGPSFKKSYTKDYAEIVDIYQLTTRILKMTPRTRDGSFQRVSDLLRTHSVDENKSEKLQPNSLDAIEKLRQKQNVHVLIAGGIAGERITRKNH